MLAEGNPLGDLQRVPLAYTGGLRVSAIFGAGVFYFSIALYAVGSFFVLCEGGEKGRKWFEIT